MKFQERIETYSQLFNNGSTKEVKIISSGGLQYTLVGAFILDSVGRPIGFMEDNKSFWPWEQILKVQLIREVHDGEKLPAM